MKAFHLVLVLGALVGCGGAGGGIHYKLEPVSPAPAVPVQPKPATCEFKVESSAPQGNYDTLGTLTPVDFAATSSDEFKRAVAADVCNLGGEIVVGKVNGAGNYISAIVYRRHMTEVTTPAGSPPPAPTPVPTPGY